MKLISEDRHYENGERRLLLRIIQPSEPRDGWLGNKETIRVWQICDKGEVVYRRVTNEEALELEGALGEIDVETAAFSEHPTLGTVLSGKLKRLPSVWLENLVLHLAQLCNKGFLNHLSDVDKYTFDLAYDNAHKRLIRNKREEARKRYMMSTNETVNNPFTGRNEK